MQDVDIELLRLSLGSTVEASRATIGLGRGLHLVGQPTFFLLLGFQVVGAVTHGLHKLKGIDSLDHSGIGDVNRDTVQPLGGVEQLGTAVGHSLQVLRVDRDVVLINGDTQVGTTLQGPLAQIGLRVVDGIGRVVLIGELHPINVGRDLGLRKHRDR